MISALITTITVRNNLVVHVVQASVMSIVLEFFSQPVQKKDFPQLPVTRPMTWYHRMQDTESMKTIRGLLRWCRSASTESISSWLWCRRETRVLLFIADMPQSPSSLRLNQPCVASAGTHCLSEHLGCRYTPKTEAASLLPFQCSMTCMQNLGS